MKIVVINQHPRDALGGSEIQCDRIARGLVERGHSVTYVAVDGTATYSDLPYRTVTVPLGGRSIARACISEEPSVVYWRLNKRRFRSVAKALNSNGIPVVFAISSDKDVLKWRIRASARAGIAGIAASAVKVIGAAWNHGGFAHVQGIISLNPDYVHIVPHPRQAFIGNTMPVAREPFDWPRPYVLWVSNLKKTKRPEACVGLARALAADGVDVVMVGRLAERRYGWFSDPTRLPPNLHYLGPRTVEEVNGALAGALVSVHTCLPEGFGNTFIQAWLQGCPTVSLGFDPGGMIREHGLGAVSGDDHRRLHQEVLGLLRDPARAGRIGGHAKAIAAEYFSADRNIQRLEEFLLDVVAGAGAAGSDGEQVEPAGSKQ
jgi:glycosyltransferase involved in cell wall biosynthesis